MSDKVRWAEGRRKSKMKIEGRQPLHSRRTSKNSPVYNPHQNENGGDSNRNGLDSVDKTPLNDAKPTKDEVCATMNGVYQMTESHGSDNSSNIIYNDLKNALNKVNGPTSLNGQEISNLKDLLIINLDLIQHQQQLLIARDRQIKTLIAEKDALKNRLERMDRRMSLLKQKGNTEDEPTAATPAGDGDTIKIPVVEKVEKATKRKSDAKMKETPRKQARHTPAKTPLIKEESPHQLRSGDPSGTPPPDPVTPPKRPAKRLEHNVVKDRIDLVRTGEDYYVPCIEFHDPDIVGKVLKSPGNKKNRIRVEVPKWRFHPLSNCYQMEGTEVTDDEVYLKRHLKFENDEKRRKRWDIQRAREQSAYQKLVANRKSTPRVEKPPETQPVQTMRPASDDIQFIEMTETLPVNVFGYALPKLSDSDFALKWPEKDDVEPANKETKPRQKRR